MVDGWYALFIYSPTSRGNDVILLRRKMSDLICLI